MVNLRLLAVADRRFILGQRGAGIRLDFDIKDGGVDSTSFTERTDDHGGLEGLGRQEKLNGEILLGLYCAELLIPSSQRSDVAFRGVTHNLNHRLAGILNCQRKRGLKASFLFFDGHKGLVRSLRLAIFLRSQDDLDSIGASKSNGFRKRGLLTEPAQTGVSN